MPTSWSMTSVALTASSTSKPSASRSWKQGTHYFARGRVPLRLPVGWYSSPQGSPALGIRDEISQPGQSPFAGLGVQNEKQTGTQGQEKEQDPAQVSPVGEGNHPWESNWGWPQKQDKGTGQEGARPSWQAKTKSWFGTGQGLWDGWLSSCALSLLVLPHHSPSPGSSALQRRPSSSWATSGTCSGAG